MLPPESAPWLLQNYGSIEYPLSQAAISVRLVKVDSAVVFVDVVLHDALRGPPPNMENEMAKFLVGIMYHDPESWELWKKGTIEDYESSTGLFIEAATGELALAWGEQVGQELLRKENADASLIWREFGYYCWLEDTPEISNWAHCLDFFQTVSEGEFPDFSELGTKAYIRWRNSQTISAAPNENQTGLKH